MEQFSLVLFWFAFALYVGATVLYAYQFVLRRSKVSWWARFLTGAGFICQTLSIGANSIVHGGTTFTGQNQLILAAWALVLLYFVMEHVLRIRAYGAFLVPIAVIVMVVAQLTGGAEALVTTLTEEQMRQIQGYGIAFHVALIVFANAGFAFGSVSAALYLYQSTQLKNRKTNKLSRRLPSLATLQSVAHRAVSFAFPIYTAGLTLGVIRAIQTDVSGWWQDPRVMMSGLVWLTYGVYLVAVYRHNVSSRFSAWLSIAGFILVVVVAILARTVPIGFHVFGV